MSVMLRCPDCGQPFKATKMAAAMVRSRSVRCPACKERVSRQQTRDGAKRRKERAA